MKILRHPVLLAITLIFSALILLSGCSNTLSGAGKDIQSWGSHDQHTVVKKTVVESPEGTSETVQTETTEY